MDLVVLKALLLLTLVTVEAENRNWNTGYCGIFALNAFQVVEHLKRGNTPIDIRFEIASFPAPDQTKDLLLQSLEFVLDRKLKNPTVAYDIALGSCIKKRDHVKNILIPWAKYYEFMQLEV